MNSNLALSPPLVLQTQQNSQVVKFSRCRLFTLTVICALTSCIGVFSYWHVKRTCYTQLHCWSNLNG